MSCLMHNKKKLAAYAAAASAAVLGTSSVAQADWSGPYAHANWTFTNLGANGGSATNQTATTLSLIGGDISVGGGGPGGAGTSQYTIAATAGTGWVSFDWAAAPLDINNWDYHGRVLNGVYTILGNNAAPASGSDAFAVSGGDTFGFFVYTDDGLFGALTVNYSNFSAIPEPTSVALLALGSIGGLSLRRRRS